MPSNSNDSPATSPAATAAQHGARGSAAGRRPEPVPPIPAVVIPAGPRFTSPVTYSALFTGPPTMGTSAVLPDSEVPVHTVCDTLSASAIDDELQAKPAHAGVSAAVHGALACPAIDPVGRADSSAKYPLPPFARVYVTTSMSFLVTLLAKQSFLGLDNPNLAQPEPTVVMPEPKLRALFMKALVWFIDRERANVDGAVVVFVGNGLRGHAPAAHLALPLDAVRKVADEFGSVGDDQEFDQEFEEFGAHTFHAGIFYVEHGGWVVAIAGILAIIGFFALVFLYVFLRDVVMQLVFLPYAL